ncbi:MAG TPA: hypothetical protein ENJ56_01765 [Anaerolineae bacterium]|nr:hypothetical protein [Anaerolineae bacterium]
MLRKSLFLFLIIALMSIGSAFAAEDAVIVFNTPVGGSEPAPAFPGDSYQVTFSAEKGQSLHLATMFVQSNDWFFSPNDWGIALYDSNGAAISGDVTRYIGLFDAGTEIDEMPGTGAHQAPRQPGPDSGDADPNQTVRRANDSFGVTPPVNQLIKAMLTDLGDGNFMLTIENISGNSTLPSPIAPGIAVVTSMTSPLFESGSADRGLGLEALAEDGNPAHLAANLGGEMMPEAPTTPAPSGSNVQVFAVPVGGEGPAPAFPGDAYEFAFSAAQGDSLHLATMLVQSNDRFFSPNEWGIPLFDSNGNALSGDMTDYVHLYDAGTELDETPGAGAHQAPRQPGPNSGATDPNNLVRRAHDNTGITPAVNQLIKVTLTHMGGNDFVLRIENVSGGSALPGPLAPGVAVVTSDVAPLFKAGTIDRDQGLEQLAEDGMPGRLAENLAQ